jgi:casein kinase 1
MLIYEARIYDKFQNTPGFPQIYWSGVEGEYSVMVMEILGPSLNALFEFCKCKFEVKTILWMAIQMITRIEVMHAQDYIHRDIKPENFLVGHNKKNEQVYIIDFGLSKRFRCPKSGNHVEKKKR